MKLMSINRLMLLLLAGVLSALNIPGQSTIPLKVDTPSKFNINGKQVYEFTIDLKQDEICNIITNASKDLPLFLQVTAPDGSDVVKEADASKSYVFVASTEGRFVARLHFFDEL